uniref:Uncharacterized protein n=1 Tax=Plectus sambesii TaxID=2011161 RepID=A0A914X367_9BILA
MCGRPGGHPSVSHPPLLPTLFCPPYPTPVDADQRSDPITPFFCSCQTLMTAATAAAAQSRYSKPDSRLR